MKNPVSITYVGPLLSGYVQCPNTGKQFPAASQEKPAGFVRGEPFDVPEVIAIALARQSPDDWQIPPSVQEKVTAALVEEEKAAKEAAAEAEAQSPLGRLKALNEARKAAARAEQEQP